MKKLLALAVLALALAPAVASAAGQPLTKQDFVKVCPLDLPGVGAASSNVADGIVVAFDTTVANSLGELQSRVQKLNDLVNLAMSQPATAPRGGVPFASTYEATEKGANLYFKPADAADLEKLQTNVAGKIGKMNAEKTCHLLANVN